MKMPGDTKATYHINQSSVSIRLTNGYATATTAKKCINTAGLAFPSTFSSSTSNKHEGPPVRTGSAACCLGSSLQGCSCSSGLQELLGAKSKYKYADDSITSCIHQHQPHTQQASGVVTLIASAADACCCLWVICCWCLLCLPQPTGAHQAGHRGLFDTSRAGGVSAVSACCSAPPRHLAGSRVLGAGK